MVTTFIRECNARSHNSVSLQVVDSEIIVRDKQGHAGKSRGLSETLDTHLGVRCQGLQLPDWHCHRVSLYRMRYGG